MAIYQIVYKSLNGEIFQIITDPTFITTKQEESGIICWTAPFQIRSSSPDLKNFIIEFGIDEGILSNLVNFVRIENMEDPSFQEAHRRILTIRIGFDKVRELLDENVRENKKFILDTQNYPKTGIEDILKRCEYLSNEPENIFCKLFPYPVTLEYCEKKCHMPEYFGKCKHLIIYKIIDTNSVPIIFFGCKRNYQIENNNPTLCIKKYCFEPQEIESPRRKELEKILKENGFLRILINKIDKINTLTKIKYKKDLFKIHAHTIWLNFHQPCLNTKDFILQINALTNLLNWMNIKEFPISSPPEEGTLNFLEQFLKENYPNYDKFIIKRFRNIIRIRQRIHTEKDTTEIMKIMREYNAKDVQQLLDEVKVDFFLSLKQLEEIFSEGNK